MRAGACATQQTLSPEAASVLKHSLTLARRRGHAQVTPLHVAATLLSSRASLLRRACLKSHPHQPSHPLQCRALELCFNVALNRLPATPGPLLHAQPSLSNALVAALKRAQAHQRRGCIEQQQQQPLIAIKVDLDQLVLSILDDPSVSRVMREAGFSSTAVKNNLEDATNSVSSVFQCYSTSGGIYSTPSSPPTDTQRELLRNPNSIWEQNPSFLFSPHKMRPLITTPAAADPLSLKEDTKVVLEVFLKKKRRNTVIVGDSLSMAEGLVAELMKKVERGDVPDELKSAHFIKFQFSAVPLRFMTKEEVQLNIADLKRKVDSFSGRGQVIIYTGDLKWTVESGNNNNDSTAYSPVDHLTGEMGKLLSWYSSSNARVWLMATANYQTYIKCQMKQPPLDVQWALQAVSVPSSGGLGLSLNAAAASDPNSRINNPHAPLQYLDKDPFWVKDEEDILNCCPECTSSYEKEVGFKSIQHKSSSGHSVNKDGDSNGSAQMPFWLRPHGTDQTLAKDDLIQLRRKYNSLCQRLHQGKISSSIISNQSDAGRSCNYSSCYPSWPNKNIVFPDSETISFAAVHPNPTASSLPRFRRQQSCHIEFSFSNGSPKNVSAEPNLDSLKGIDEKEVKITLALGNSAYMDEELCEVLKENVPWQSETIPLIVEAVTDSKGINRDKFILIQGNDLVGKRRIAIGIAKVACGSSDFIFHMSMRQSKDTVEQHRNKLEKALRIHQKLVVLVEDVDCADPEFVKYLVDGYLTGKLEMLSRHEQREVDQSIFILTTNGCDSCLSKATENTNSIIHMKLAVNQERHGLAMPSPNHKRKANWDLSIKIRSPRSNEMEEVSSGAAGTRKREFSRQLSPTGLDLNIKADEEDVKEVKPGEVSPISSDLTREIAIEHNMALKFLKKIKNCFVLSRDTDQEVRAKDMILSKVKRCFQEFEGSTNINSFDVEDAAVEKILMASGSYLNSLFEQWLKEVLQRSLWMVDTCEGGKVSIRLSIEGKGEGYAEEGFRGTCLPKKIHISLTG